MNAFSPLYLKLSARIRRFAESRLVQENAVTLQNEAAPLSLSSFASQWEVTSSVKNIEPGVWDFRVRFHLHEGECDDANLGVGLEVEDWQQSNYVFMPAAVYQGNRFPTREISYPPLLDHPTKPGDNDLPIITDVPRLSLTPGLSQIQLLSGDAALPCFGYYDRSNECGVLIFTTQNSVLGENGLLIQENPDRSSALFFISSPGVRSETCYRLCSTRVSSPDRGVKFLPGANHEITLRLVCFPAAQLQDLFSQYHRCRAPLTPTPTLRHELPFSAAFSIIEDKYNHDNWNADDGYYRVGLGSDRYQDWQAGWTGGLMSTHPLLFAGQQPSRERALRTLDFVFNQGGSGASGFFHGCYHQGVWSGDGFHYPGCDHYHMTRKSADALFFLIKQFDLFQKQNPAWPLSESWKKGTLACADAFVRLWRRYGELGQFVDIRTGDMIIGGTASAAIAPAGLAWASRFFQRPEYLETAQNVARHYYRHFVGQGLTNGGPGEILQCPDSESAIGLVESFLALWEITGEAEWLRYGEDAAQQCLTWMMPYDYQFPPTSLFGRMDMKTAGSIWANVQNKHSAPGYCTLSGDCLLKLFRATGNQLYLEALRLTAHNLTQYLSREDRPIGGLRQGWINERVNTSDWLEPPGEIFTGSCWPEISCLLTAIEVPGIYARLDTGFISVLDHVEVEIREHTADRLTLRINNPTRFDAQIRLLAEGAEEARRPLGLNGLREHPLKSVRASESITVILTSKSFN